MALETGCPRAAAGAATPLAGLVVAAAAIIEQGRLLVVSTKAAADDFSLPGGQPEPGETARETVIRALREGLGAWATTLTLLGQFDGLAALEGVTMRMTVLAAALSGPPHPGAGLAALGWTTGADEY